MPTPIERLLERITLRAATAAAAAVPEPERARRAQTLKRLRRRGEAADAICCDGHRAEAARVLAAALDATLELVDEAVHGRLLALRGLDPNALGALPVRLRATPPRDVNVGALDDDAFRRGLRALRALGRALDDASRAPSALRRLRRGRVAAAVGAVALAVTLGFAPLPTLPRREISASGHWSTREHVAADAFDGDRATEWHGAELQPGWIELRVAPPVEITRLRLRNGRGAFGDRAAALAIVRVFSRGREVGAFEHRFLAVEAAPEPVVFDVDARVDRIRVDVPTFHGRGPAIAEIDWE